MRGAGPLLEVSNQGSQLAFKAVRPFWSHVEAPEMPYRSTHVLWPLLSTRETDRISEQVGLFYVYRHQVQHDRNDKTQTWLLPVWISGKSEDGKSYAGLFPLGGVARDFFGYDRIGFALFPLYTRMKKGDTHGVHVLWPIYADIRGTEFHKWRIFPFYGESEGLNQWNLYFALWPFVQWGHSTNPDVEGSALSLLPFYGRIDTRHADGSQFMHNRTWLWPFFSWYEDEKGTRLHAPWPVVQIRRNHPEAGYDRTYVWPLYGHDVRGDRTIDFWLWPFFWHVTHSNPQGAEGTEVKSRDNWYFFPFYWSFKDVLTPDDIEHANDAEEVTYKTVWPLFSTAKQGDTMRHTRFLALYPMRKSAGVERNLAPLWTLYEYQREEDRRQHDLLWGLWQYKATAETTRKVSLFPFFSYRREDPDSQAKRLDILTGLFGRETAADGTRKTRLLWFLRF